MVGVREKSCGSWFDPWTGWVVGWLLGKRLWERCNGRKGLFLTLTYDRKPYREASDLWYQAQERQDVALFMRRLGRALGISLKGKWLCKLEFQEGGWVHWHLVLLDVEWVDADTLARCWGHGFTKAKALNKKRCFYLCKYVAKGGRPLPSFLLSERPRAVRVVRVSNGFWGPPAVREEAGGEEPSGYLGSFMFKAIGQRFRQGRGVVVRVGRRSERRTYSIMCSYAAFVAALMSTSEQPPVMHRGWMWFRADQLDVDRAAAVARVWERRPQAKLPGREPPRSGGLDLSGTRKADVEGWPAELKWLDDMWRQAADEATEVAWGR
jgi:hypothetical protein